MIGRAQAGAALLPALSACCSCAGPQPCPIRAAVERRRELMHGATGGHLNPHTHIIHKHLRRYLLVSASLSRRSVCFFFWGGGRGCRGEGCGVE